MEFNDTTGIDSPGNGFMSGAFDACVAGADNEADGTCEVVCAYAENVNSGTQNMIYCVGQHPAHEDARMTILLVENE